MSHPVRVLSGERFDPVPLARLAQIGGPKLAATLAGMFLGTATARGDEITAAAAARDWQSCGRLAHALRATAGNVGARRVHDLCEGVENAVTDGEDSAVMELAALAPGEIAEASKVLSDWLTAQNAPQPQ